MPIPSSPGPAGASKVARVLREMIRLGRVTQSEFKNLHVTLGGTKNSTHAFDRYFIEKKSSRWGYVPNSGSHALLRRAEGRAVEWTGPGDTFEERATAWLRRLARVTLDRFAVLAEADMLAESDAGRLDIAGTWFVLAEAEGLRRSREMLADPAPRADPPARVHRRRKPTGAAYYRALDALAG